MARFLPMRAAPGEQAPEPCCALDPFLARHADRDRPHRRTRPALLAQRQDHGARGPHLVVGQRGEVRVFHVMDAHLGQHVVMHGERKSGRGALGRRRLAHQHALGHRIDERRVQSDRHDALLAEVLGGVVGQPGGLGIIGLLGVRVLPIVAPASADVHHVAGQDTARFQALGCKHRFDIAGGDHLPCRHRLAAAHQAFRIE
jgi:hypothetical protein